MAAVPEAMPDTTPALLIVATEVLPLIQMPAGVASLRVVVAPVQSVVEPVMGAGSGFTVTTVVVYAEPGSV